MLKRLADEASPDAAIDHFVDEFAAKQAAHVPGQLEQVVRSSALTAGDWVGGRPDAIYVLRLEGELLKIRSQGRELALPAAGRDTVVFALESKRYRVKDLPGDYDEADKVALIRSLIDEGLVRLLP